jgi:hypothetical protein
MNITLNISEDSEGVKFFEIPNRNDVQIIGECVVTLPKTAQAHLCCDGYDAYISIPNKDYVNGRILYNLKTKTDAKGRYTPYLQYSDYANEKSPSAPIPSNFLSLKVISTKLLSEYVRPEMFVNVI